MAEQITIQWNRAARGPRPANPCFKLSPEVLIELPPADWGHGDLLLYLPRRGWLVRTISTDVAAFALESLHDLLTRIAKGSFPPAGVREAEVLAARVAGAGAQA